MDDTPVLITVYLSEKSTGIFLIDIYQDVVKLYFEKYLNTGGYSSLSPTNNIILTDTYPDRYGEL